jgi:hypothetical protein
MIFKNLVLQALGTIWFRFLQKKYLKKFHACVPLKPTQQSDTPFCHADVIQDFRLVGSSSTFSPSPCNSLRCVVIENFEGFIFNLLLHNAVSGQFGVQKLYLLPLILLMGQPPLPQPLWPRTMYNSCYDGLDEEYFSPG